MNSLALFILSFSISLALVPLVRWFSGRIGAVAPPRDDRWHHSPVSRLGGVAIFMAFLGGLIISSLVIQGEIQIRWELLVCSGLIFLIGLYDDLRPLSPPAKLIAQILISALAISFGYSTRFFSPRIENEIVAQLPNILLTFIWLVGITNAFNLLDNMDGLAAGIALIASGILSYFFLDSGDWTLLAMSLALAGAVSGFLVFNFPPASIFMGDNGSLFLGFTLAVLAIARQPQASNVLAVMGVPTLLFLLPILDTILVTLTRVLRGQSPVQGGRDHSSHRLIAFGLTERQSVLALYGVALLSGIAAALLEAVQYWFSLVLVPLLVVSLALLFAYLGGLRVMPPVNDHSTGSRFTRIMLDLTFRRRLLEVILDFFLIGSAYYLAHLVSNGLSMNEIQLGRFLDSLPVILMAAYITFFGLGVYRGVWRYLGLRDLLRLFGAALGSVILAAVVLLVLNSTSLLTWERSSAPSSLVLALLAIFLFLGLAASRSSFRVLSYLMPRRSGKDEIPVLIYGAGDAGILLVDWIGLNLSLNYLPVGFLDDDPFLNGRWIHGLKVLGGLSQLETILDQHRVAGLIVAEENRIPDLKELLNRCQQRGCWVRRAALEFELLQ